jgi:hypothetical protein
MTDLLIPPPAPEYPTPEEWEAYLAKRAEARRSMALVMVGLQEKCRERLHERGVPTKEKKELRAALVVGKNHLAALGFPEGVEP